MSQTLNIAVILFRNLGEALLKTAAEIGNGDGNQPAIAPIKANLDTQIIEKPEFSALKVGDRVMFSVIERKKLQRHWGTIRKIEGEKISITNSVLKRDWEVAPHEVIYQEVPSLQIK